MPVTAAPVVRPVADVHAAFLTHLARFRACARFAFRHVPCADTRADLIAEAVALAWKQFAALARRGRAPEGFITTLALRCTQAVRAGRRLVRSESARDAFSLVAMARHRFAVERLGRHQAITGPVAEALADNTRSRVPDQAAFRIDFPRWRAGFRRRDRAVLDALLAGGRTGEVARAFRISPARVSQFRRAFEYSWAAFHRGSPGPAGTPALVAPTGEST